MTKPGYDKQARAAVDRLDILEREDELPVGVCAIRGCQNTGMFYAQPTLSGRLVYICIRHRSLYRVHDRIVARIRSLRDRDIL